MSKVIPLLTKKNTEMVIPKREMKRITLRKMTQKKTKPFVTRKQSEKETKPTEEKKQESHKKNTKPTQQKEQKSYRKSDNVNALLVGVGKKENDNEFECSFEKYNLGDYFSNKQEPLYHVVKTYEHRNETELKDEYLT